MKCMENRHVKAFLLGLMVIARSQQGLGRDLKLFVEFFGLKSAVAELVQRETALGELLKALKRP